MYTALGGSITSGNSVTAFSSKSSNYCSSLSESRDCIDGNLSGSYNNSSCSTPAVVVPPPVVIPPTPIPWYVTNARSFTFSQGSGYYSPGNINVNSNGTFSGDYKEMYCIYAGMALESDGNSCLYQGSWYPTSTPGVTFVRGDFGFSGNISTAGSGSGNWFKVGGGANGVIYFSPSGGGVSGQFSNSAGVYIPYTAY